MNRLRGLIWARGVAAERHDEHGDLFAFSYRPEPWFEDEDWRKRNAFVGMVGAGLLRLDSRDK